MSGIALGTHGDLLVGDDTGDDAAVYKLTADTALIFTVDFITPLINDPFLYGQIAATNSISDIYAMGGKPLLALNVCCFPQEGLPKEDLNAVLKGGLETAQRAGCLVVGGHTVKDQELKYGMAVVGTVHPEQVKRNSTPKAGEKLILTKPIGSGVVVTGAKMGLVTEEELRATCESMTILNNHGCAVAQEYDASALTDVTGFGLGGHALGMVKGGKVGYRLFASKIPTFPQAMGLIRRGVRTGVTMSNFETLKPFLKIGAGVDQASVALLCDPQTAGPLLMPVPAGRADQALEALRARGHAQAELIGEVYDTGGAPEITLEA